jgi:ferredoxin
MMVAMGSGITPIMGMLRAIANMPPRERPLVQLHYASRSPDEIIFGDELDEMDPQETWLQQRHYLSSRRQRMSVEAIVSHAGSMGRRADWYVCGADSFKRELHERLTRLRVAERQIHSEVFAAQPGPAYRLGASPATGGSISIAETGASLDVEPNETLLTGLERHGYRPNFSCRVGACGSCKLRLLGGEVDQVGEVLSAAERDDGYVLSCIAHPIGDVTLASGGRPPAGVRRVTYVAGAVSGPTAGGTALTRVAAVVGVGALLLGTWNLTDHRPQSWDVITAPTPQATAADPDATALPSPTTTTAGGTGPAPKPTATPTRATSTGGAPAPTPTRAAPAPTATPKPTPVCHSTPSKPC